MRSVRFCETVLLSCLLSVGSLGVAVANPTSNQNLKDPLDFVDRAEEAATSVRLSVSPAPADAVKAAPATKDTPAQSVSPEAPVSESTPEAELEPEFSALQLALQAALQDETQSELTELYALYVGRTWQPIWLTAQGSFLKPRAHQFVEVLRGAKAHGLDPHAYGVRQLASLLDVYSTSAQFAEADVSAELDLKLTAAFLEYARDIAGGVTNPQEVLRKVFFTPQVPTPARLLQDLETSSSVAAMIETLEPEAPSYDKLKEQLQRYDAAQASYYPVYIEDGSSLRVGDRGPRVRQLANRLRAEGYLPDFALTPDAQESYQDDVLYTPEMEQFVQAFQQENGLEPDGVVGKNTRAALNISLEDRRNQVLVNLERMRWDDPLPNGRYVLVNVAEQMARIMEGTTVLYETRSVVGKPKFATPLFSDEMGYAEINPTWGVPWSIATNEYLPKLRRNPQAVTATGIEVFKGGKRVNASAIDWNAVSKRGFGYQLRQKAGRNNALGAVKFMFPNKHNIYLHDTPAKRLFQKDIRAFSHGCIRLQDPFMFGEVLLSSSGYSRATMERLKARGKTARLTIKDEIPVHLRYYTAFADQDGTIQFRKDIYDQDNAILEALMQAQETSRAVMASVN